MSFSLIKYLHVWIEHLYSKTSNTSSLSENDGVVLEKLITMEERLGTMIVQLEGSTYSSIDLDLGPKKKKVSSCPPLGTITTFCSIFVIMAHDVVLFVTRENMTKNHGMRFPLRIWPNVSSLC